MRKVLTSTICIAAAISLTACGSSASKPSNTQVATTALTQELIKQSASTAASPLKFNTTQAGCTATRVVSSVGEAKLQSYGLLDAKFHGTPKTLDEVTLSKADATAVVGAIIDCLGEATFTTDLSEAVTSSITGANTGTQRTCLQDKLTVAALKPMLISSLSGDKLAATHFYAGLLTCTRG